MNENGIASNEDGKITCYKVKNFMLHTLHSE